MSTTLGVAAQLKETADEAHRREASATQTLQLLKQTSGAVFDIQRLLSPFVVSEVTIGFEVACEDPKFANFCAQARKLKDKGKWGVGESIYGIQDPALWKMWPEQPARLALQLFFFRNGPTVQELAKGIVNIVEADLSVDVDATISSKNGSLFLNWDDGKVSLVMDGYIADDRVHSTGKIVSLMDLQGASLAMTSLDDRLAVLTPIWISIKTKQGQGLNIDAAKSEKISVGGQTAYLFKYEKLARPAESDKTLPKK